MIIGRKTMRAEEDEFEKYAIVIYECWWSEAQFEMQDVRTVSGDKKQESKTTIDTADIRLDRHGQTCPFTASTTDWLLSLL
jgi:hypothetical protein